MPFSKLFTLKVLGADHTVRIVTAEYAPAHNLPDSGNQPVVDVKDIHTGVHFYGILRGELKPKRPESNSGG